jgi:penicillin amidase
MIVSLTPETEAYGVYPGGQSGNPGSKFYDNFVDAWAQGNYNKLWVMKSENPGDSKIKWTMSFSKL